MKLKALLPCLREKKRYVAFIVETKDKLEARDAKKEIEDNMQRFLGDLGMANVGLMFLKDWKDNKGLARVNSKYVDHFKASLALIKEINGKKVVVKSIGVSGLVGKLRKSYFKEG